MPHYWGKNLVQIGSKFPTKLLVSPGGGGGGGGGGVKPEGGFRDLHKMCEKKKKIPPIK